MRRLLSVALSAALVLTLAGTTLAAKGGNGSKGNGGSGGGGSTASTIVVLVPTGAAASTAINYGATIGTFSTYDSSLTQVYVDVTCVANASTVSNLSVGSTVYDVMQVIVDFGGWSTNGYAYFSTTTSPAWTGGGANCTAALMTYVMHNADRVWKTLASTSFSVQP